MGILRTIGEVTGVHVHDWEVETAILDRDAKAVFGRGWTRVRECRECHRVEEHYGDSQGGYWNLVEGLDLVDLRRALKRFRRRWVMIGDRRVRKGSVELRARAAIREAERLGLR